MLHISFMGTYMWTILSFSSSSRSCSIFSHLIFVIVISTSCMKLSSDNLSTIAKSGGSCTIALSSSSIVMSPTMEMLISGCIWLEMFGKPSSYNLTDLYLTYSSGTGNIVESLNFVKNLFWRCLTFFSFFVLICQMRFFLSL